VFHFFSSLKLTKFKPLKMHVSLTRIIIFGQAIDKLKTFYVDNFNLAVIEETKHEWVVLSAGPIEIALHRIGQAYRIENGKDFKADGNIKLVFDIAAGLTQFRQKLVEQGVLMSELKSFAGINYLFCDGEDPEGNVFQLQQSL
jgi:hypothetical protein